MPKYQFTREDRKRGFRAAVLQAQIKHGLEFNEAVQWLKRKIGWKSKKKGGEINARGTTQEGTDWKAPSR